MNRHQRRAARAGGNAIDDEREIPEPYLRTCNRMIDELRAWLAAHPETPPRFALPPADAFAIACLDQVADAIARNASARELVERFCSIGVAIQPPQGHPTIEMLRIVLEHVALPYETEPLEHFGRWRPLLRCGDA